MTHLIRKYRPAFIVSVIAMTALVFMAFTNDGAGEPAKGKTLFENNCVRCHGANGAKGFFGAANLKKSVMTEEAIMERIRNGKRFMPSFKKRFSAEEIKELAGYVKTLRTN